MSRKKKMYEIYYFNMDNELIIGCFFEGTLKQTFDVAVSHAEAADADQFFVIEDGETVVLAAKQREVTDEELWSQVIEYQETEEYVLISKKKPVPLQEQLDEALKNEEFEKAAKLRDKIEKTEKKKKAKSVKKK